MTLCIAWRDNNGHLHLASDSRLTFGGDRAPSDVGIKLFPVPLVIKSALPMGGQESDRQIHRQTIGVCTAGSHTMAAVVIPALGSVLSSLQVASNQANGVTMPEIANAISAVVQDLGKEVASVLFKAGLGALLVVGYCPAQRKGRAFEVTLEERCFRITSRPREILEGTGVHPIGSGASSWASMDGDGVAPFRELKRIIDDTSVTTVGGPIQYGKLDDQDFIVIGVRQLYIDESTNSARMPYVIAGCHADGSGALPLPPGLLLGGHFVDPFGDQIGDLIDRRIRFHG